MYRLAIVSTHPIQYNTPWFQILNNHPEIDLHVYFCHQASAKEQAQAGFGVEFDWDTSLLEDYNYRFLKNVATNPSISSFRGLDTPEINSIIGSENFDAVLVSGWTYKAAWQTFFACWRTNTPVMVRGDSHLYTQRSWFKRKFKTPFYRWFLRKMSACLAVGKWSSEYYLHYGVDPECIFFVPHVVDEDFFVTTAKNIYSERNRLRADWGIPESAVVYLFCGKLINKKRPIDFVNAIKLAEKDNPNIFGLIVGDGPLRAECERLVKKNKLPIVFAGFLNQTALPRAYVASDCLVLPSGGETWGLVVNESMLCGIPALVSDQVGCGPDLIVPNVTGDSFKMGDVSELSEKMVQYAKNQEHLRLIGWQARSRILERYGMQQAVSGTLQAIKCVSGN